MKTENWNGNTIRFVERNGEWWAVLKDVCNALGLDTRMTSRRLDDDVLFRHFISDSLGRQQEMLIVSEYGIYEVIFRSNKPEAKDFRKWVYEMLASLRKKTGLEGFEVFRMLDKEHQKEMMRTLSQNLDKPARVDFIKANTIANKAVSNKHGFPKLVKKSEMSPAMLVDIEGFLSDTVELMSVKDKYGMDFSVSEAIYKKAAGI